MATEAVEQLTSSVHYEATTLCGICSCWRINWFAERATTSKRLTLPLMSFPIHPAQYLNDIQAVAKISVVNPGHGDTRYESRMRRSLAGPDLAVRSSTARDSFARNGYQRLYCPFRARFLRYDSPSNRNTMASDTRSRRAITSAGSPRYSVHSPKSTFDKMAVEPRP